MTKERYLEIKSSLDKLNWADYAYNLDLLLLDLKEQLNLTDEDMLDFEGFSKCDSLNTNEEGFYKDYDCKLCRNRTYNHFHEVKNGKIYYYVMDCECKKIRNEYQRLQDCGISTKQLDKFYLEKYMTLSDWQKNLKDAAIKFLDDYKANTKDFNNWFVASGQPGTGKSHICTAIYRELLLSGKKVKFMPWKDTMDRLLLYKKSSYAENQKKYEKEINELKMVDVLYIDDFFKSLPLDGYVKDQVLDLAYMIINARYSNELITIISTEYLVDEIMNIDNAICGRIKERSKEYWMQIRKDPGRDYRMNNKEK